jgi:hypothetical protein
LHYIKNLYDLVDFGLRGPFLTAGFLDAGFLGAGLATDLTTTSAAFSATGVGC